jgi:hypothetical protein
MPFWLLAAMVVRQLCLLMLFSIVATAQSTTVPLIVEGNVPMIDLEFVRPDGSTQAGRFAVDSGGGAFILSNQLAKAIGLKPSGPSFTEEAVFAPAPAPVVRVGGMPLDLNGAKVAIQLSPDRLDSRDAVDGLFPGHVLERYHVIFDYPGHKFTLATPGSLKPRGNAVPAPLKRVNGFPRVEVAIGDRKVGMLLDTGASFTMISRKAMDEWSASAPNPWPRRNGAVGAANMAEKNDAVRPMVRIPEIRLGDYVIRNAGAVARPEGTYETRMSSYMVAPILGALAGNVLRQFRVEIDYAAGVVYFERAEDAEPHDLDMVGLIFGETSDNSLVVSGISSEADQALRNQVKVGDRLLSVDGVSVSSFSLMQIVDRLRGKSGDEKKLELEHEGKRYQIQARVTRIM